MFRHGPCLHGGASRPQSTNHGHCQEARGRASGTTVDIVVEDDSPIAAKVACRCPQHPELSRALIASFIAPLNGEYFYACGVAVDVVLAE